MQKFLHTEGSDWKRYGRSSSQPAIRRETPKGRTPLCTKYIKTFMLTQIQRNILKQIDSPFCLPKSFAPVENKCAKTIVQNISILKKNTKKPIQK